ncbi:MAG: hypothetical protein KAS63_04070 [Candidatus Heimdallarchaeota archaeon]|nr:hypothetical protein [Candidatus Heimdallarchaeota archaeon]MCK4954511.1 hypothetical protein [Candidatus Heimdallarchaeota archaeon]
MSLSSSSTLKPLLTRISFGLILPFLIEILVYIIYTGLRTQDFQYSFILVFVFFIVPILFLYLVGPKLIFQGGRVKKNIEQNLKNNFEKVFLKPRNFIVRDKTIPLSDMELKLTKKEKEIIQNKIQKRLIPEILKDAEKQYNQNFVDRSHTTRNERLLTYNESLFLFSFVTSILSLINLILIIILSQRSIIFDFFVLDKLDSIVNVIVFASIFGALLLSSIYLFFISARQLCRIIPRVLPIIYYEPEIEREKRISQIQSIAEFPISNLFVRRTQRELSGSIEEAKRRLLLSRLTETISWYYRDEMAKTNAWKLYKEVLEETQISNETKERIEHHFKFDPLVQLISSNILTSDEEQAIKADIDYVQEKIENWDKIRKEEQTLSFLLIYRTLETIFRKALSDFVTEPQGEDVNFIKLIDILQNNKLITKDEVTMLHEVRFKRNVLFHSPGKTLDIGKSTMEKLLLLINKIIKRINE